MTLKELVVIAENERDSKVHIVKDCGDRWALSFKADKGKTGSAPMFIFKNDYHMEYFFVGDYVDLLLNGTNVDLS